MVAHSPLSILTALHLAKMLKLGSLQDSARDFFNGSASSVDKGQVNLAIQSFDFLNFKAALLQGRIATIRAAVLTDLMQTFGLYRQPK